MCREGALMMNITEAQCRRREGRILRLQRQAQVQAGFMRILVCHAEELGLCPEANASGRI